MKNTANVLKGIVVQCFLVSVVVAVLVPLAFPAQNPWVSTGGPLGGLGYDVRIDPNNSNNMFVTDNWAGVVKSVNAGQSWSQSNSGITVKGGPSGDAINIFSLTIDQNNSNIIWAGTQGGGSAFGIFKSTDGGTTWTLKTNGITLGSDVGLVFRGFTVLNGNSNTVYAQAEVSTTTQGWQFNRVKGRVYKTTDGGDTWQLIWQGNNLARYLIIDPTNPNTLYLSTGIFDREAYNSDCANGTFGGVGVLKSTDGGVTWNTINNGLTDLYVGSLRMHPTNPQILLAGTGNNACSAFGTANVLTGLFKTTNGGASWTKLIANDIITTVNFSPSNPSIAYAGSSFAFYQSTDGGTTWSKFQQPGGLGYGPLGVHAGFPIDVVVGNSNPNLLYANNYGGGVFRSQDGSVTWQVWSKGYSGADIHKVLISPTDTSSVYATGRSGPFISSDHGDDWVGITNGDASIGNFEWYTIAQHPSNASTILMSDQHQGKIFLSVDSGNTFIKVAQHPNSNASSLSTQQGFRSIVFAPSNPNVVYAGLAMHLVGSQSNSATPTGTVIYKSTMGGIFFTPMPSVLDGNNVNKLIVDPANENIVYAATSNGVYKSTDGASTWTKFSGLGSRKIETMAINPQQTSYIAAGEVFGGVWVSQDGGTTWSGPNNSGFNSANPYITSVVVDPTNSNVVFAGDLYSGVYKSTDKGFTWTPYPDSTMSGLAVRAVKDIVVNDQVLYAATQGGGVFRYNRTSFYDVSLTHWAENYVEAIYSAGITHGCGNNNYCPGSNVTRGQMAAFIIRALYPLCDSQPSTFTYTQTPYFSDVQSSNIFFKYVQKLKDLNITTVQQGSAFNVDQSLTRSQMAAFIVRARQVKNNLSPADSAISVNNTTTAYFTDVLVGSTYFLYVQKLHEDSLTTKQVGGPYDANGNVTRDQMAAFVSRAFLGMQ